MPKTRAGPDRCANCNAFLPAAASASTASQCAYCGVAYAQPSAVAVPPAPTLRPKPPSTGRSWLPVVLLLAAGLWGWTRYGHGLVPMLTSSPGTTSSGVPERAADPLTERTRADDREPSPKPPRHRAQAATENLRAEPCHVSGMEMSSVVAANQTRARRCFDDALLHYPANVGLTSDWEVEVDGAGHVQTARGRLHLLDYQRSPEDREQTPIALPGSAAVSCAETAIRSWVFPLYSPKDGGHMRMKCHFNFVVKDL